MKKQYALLLGLFVVVWCGSLRTAGAWTQFHDKVTNKPVYWKKMPIQYAIDANGLGEFYKKNPQFGADKSEFAAIELSFQVWQHVYCPSGGAVGLTLQSLGFVKGKLPGRDENCNGCNTNLIIFITDKNKWTYSTQEIAVTPVGWRPASGEIFDADILLNAAYQIFSTQTSNQADIRHDLQSVVTHEVGHFLGLDHSENKEATMYAQGSEKELKKRTLHEDDVKGICTIYPPRQSSGKVPSYTMEERNRGFGGCSSAKDPRISLWGLFLLFFLLKKRGSGFSRQS